jgi:hypothetical protein
MKRIEYEKVNVNFNDILNNILPSIEIEEDIDISCDRLALDSHKISYNKENTNETEAEVKLAAGEYTHDYYNGESTGFFNTIEEDGVLKVHMGVDISYGKDNPLTCIHPNVYSPVSGFIEEVDKENGKIVIKEYSVMKEIRGLEMNVRYYHVIEHLDEINEYIKVGIEVFGGQSCIGKMGGRSSRGRYWYPQHVHYGIKMKTKHYTGTVEHVDKTEGVKNEEEDLNKWFYINPEELWDNGIELGFMELEHMEEKYEEESKTEESNLEEKQSIEENEEIDNTDVEEDREEELEDDKEEDEIIEGLKGLRKDENEMYELRR